MRPSEAGDNPEAALQRLRRGPSLIPSSLHLDFGPVDWSDPVTRRRFDGLCRLAKSLSVAVLTMHAAPAGTPLADEIKRLTQLLAPPCARAWSWPCSPTPRPSPAIPRSPSSSARPFPGWA